MFTAIIASLALIVALVRPVPVDWVRVYEQAAPAVVPLHEAVEGRWATVCSLVVVNLDPAIAFGEEHCFNQPNTGPLRVGPSTFEVVGVWNELVAVHILVPWKGMKALEVRDSFPKNGEDVALLGYGQGALRPQFSVGRVFASFDPALDLFFAIQGRTAAPSLYADILSIHGHSGGPIIDKDLRLVTLVRWSVDDGGRSFIKSISPALVTSFYEAIINR